ncbi:MAG: bifunctional diguanylate cyclase/phosphodiesterase, partial [Leptospiraceae bacterium]|nr:bifunctional diguanylate cyclase/phosphodiesterase [Leptospiraceae bacterium]
RLLNEYWNQICKILNLKSGIYSILNEFEFELKNKKVFLELNINPVELYEKNGFIAIIRDISIHKEQKIQFEKDQDFLIQKIEKTESDFIYLTKHLEKESNERKAAEASLEFLAYHDPLTGLLNRIAMTEFIENSIKSLGQGELLALLFIDLEKFKLINDFLGHQIGDEILRRVSIRLENCVKSKGKVSRQGGDEFLILINEFQNLKDIIQICEDIIIAISEKYFIFDHELNIDLNIGISIYPEDGNDQDSLIRSAGVALRKAKDSPSEKYKFYNTEMSLELYEQLILRNWLKMALTNGELSLYYQPKLSVSANKIESVEALIRWDHPERGKIPPTVFIPVAEQMGLIIDIGYWVCEKACQEINKWTGSNIPKFAVNLSPVQFSDPLLCEQLSNLIKKYKINPEHLELEITESGVMQDIDYTIDTLFKLKEMGFTLTIDDFRTGYSSRSYLKKFPVHNIKIDKSFIVDVPYVEKDCAVVKAIVELAKSLGLYIIAEGIENEEQLEFLISLGVNSIQGFLVSKPMNGKDLVEKYFAK